MTNAYFNGPKLLAELQQIEPAFPGRVRHGRIQQIGRYGVFIDGFRLPVTRQGDRYVRRLGNGSVVDAETTKLLLVIPESYGFGRVVADEVYLERGLRLRRPQGVVVPVSPAHYIEEPALSLHSHSPYLFTAGWAWLCVRMATGEEGIAGTIKVVRAFLSEPERAGTGGGR